MALVVSSLESSIYAAFKTAQSQAENNGSDPLQNLSKQLAIAIDAYIKTAQVMPGIAVTTPVGPGATSAPGQLM